MISVSIQADERRAREGSEAKLALAMRLVEELRGKAGDADRLLPALRARALSLKVELGRKDAELKRVAEIERLRWNVETERLKGALEAEMRWRHRRREVQARANRSLLPLHRTGAFLFSCETSARCARRVAGQVRAHRTAEQATLLAREGVL